MRDYPTLHLDTNKSKGTAGSKKGYGCKWTWETIQHYTWTQNKVKKQCFYCCSIFHCMVCKDPLFYMGLND